MKGIIYGIVAFLLWGALPIFWKQLDSLASPTIISHRILFGIITLIPVLAYRGRLKTFLTDFHQPNALKNSLITGSLLAVNWVIYLWATLNGKVVEVALGYYLLPLIYVVLGYTLFGERHGPLKAAAVILAAIGVAFQAYAIGAIPWCALGVAFSFALYGLIKKKTSSDGLTALTQELTVIAPIAIIFLLIPTAMRGPVTGNAEPITLIYIALTGLATILPLLFFTAAARRIDFATLGMLQFIAPTGQFLTGWLHYKEPLNQNQLISFAIIWAAVTLYSISALKKKPLPKPSTFPKGDKKH